MLICRKEQDKFIIFNTLLRQIVEIDDELYFLVKNYDVQDEFVRYKIIRMLQDMNIVESEEELYQIIFLDNLCTNTFSAPLQIYLSINNLCNLQCSHCFNLEVTNSVPLAEFISMENILRVIEIFKKFGIYELKLTGGEPFLHPNLLEILYLLEKNEILYTIYTNGYYLSDIFVSFFNNSKYLKKLKLSIDGNEEINNMIRGNEILKIIITRFKRIRSDLVECNMTLNKLNYKTVHKLLEFLHQNNLDINVDLNLIRYNDQLLNKESDLIFRIDNDYIDFAEYCIDNGYININTRYDSFFNCPAGQLSCAINVKGDVFPCGIIQHLPTFKMGNINKTDFKGIWNNPKMINFSQCEECLDCNYYQKRCFGGCRTNAYFCNNNIHGKDPFCVYYKELLKNIK